MKTKIFGILTFAMIALAGTGVAFGHWYDSANVNMYVQTGYLAITLNNPLQPTITGQCPACPPTVTATQTIASDDTPSTDPSVTGDVMWINITNAYPGICVNGTFSIDNVGTVPAQFLGVTPTLTDADSEPSTDLYFIVATPTSGYIFDDGQYMAYLSWSIDNSGVICPQGSTLVHWNICFMEGLEPSTESAWFMIQSTWNFQNCEPIGVVAAPGSS